MGVKIVHLYPKEMNLYGDTGNVICLYERLRKRGFGVEVINVGINEKIPNFDIMFIGGGQDKEMRIIEKDLRHKSEMISYCVEQGKAILGICGGFQMLGNYYKTYQGDVIKLSGALDFYTVGSDTRCIGNYAYKTDFTTVVGFENHSGLTYLSDKLQPLGEIIKGYGNDATGNAEGVKYKNTIGTYAHGCVLPKNPAFADEIIKRALKLDELQPLDDELENMCHEKLLKRFFK